MNTSVFISGNSTGIGKGLTLAALKRKWSVYGLSRSGCEHMSGDIHDIRCDLAKLADIEAALQELFKDVSSIDVLILNAGILGEIRSISQTPVESLEQLMNINVWANKVILDWLFSHNIHIAQVVAISSGVALSSYKGWAGYSISKAVFKGLIELFALEFSHTHFISLAPGLADTRMQEYLRDESSVAAEEFPSMHKFRAAHGTEKMPSADEVAESILALLPTLHELPSGSFIDRRNM